MKAIAVCTLLTSISLSSLGQGYPKSGTDTVQMHVRLDKSKIPKDVMDAFYAQYPLATSGDWYGYPSFASSMEWYDYNPYYYPIQYPENYVVEFNNNDNAYKVIYSKTGTKIASHKTMTMDMPTAVTEAINNSEYKTWMISKDKEEIFKDADSDELKVYKVAVVRGTERHTLYFQRDGKMLKDKKIA